MKRLSFRIGLSFVGKMNSSYHVAVVGAGAFGGWTALKLLRRGARVTLLDAWGPGNSRASSGGETRLIRSTYGAHRIYVEMSVRAGELWREEEERWNVQLYQRTGLLWMAEKSDEFVNAAMPLLRDAGVAFEEMTPAAAGQRYPQINFEQVESTMLETEAGALLARRNCRLVAEAFVSEGGTYRQLAAAPYAFVNQVRALPLSDGSNLEADVYVVACRPCMRRL